MVIKVKDPYEDVPWGNRIQFERLRFLNDVGDIWHDVINKSVPCFADFEPATSYLSEKYFQSVYGTMYPSFAIAFTQEIDNRSYLSQYQFPMVSTSKWTYPIY